MNRSSRRRLGDVWQIRRSRQLQLHGGVAEKNPGTPDVRIDDAELGVTNGFRKRGRWILVDDAQQ